MKSGRRLMRFCGGLSGSGAIATALPGDRFAEAVMDGAAEEHPDEQRRGEDRDRDVYGGEVRTGDAVVKAEKRTHPENPNNGGLPEGASISVEGERNDRQAEEEQHVENSPESQRDGAGEEQGQIFRPALDHLRQGAVHACGEGVRRVAEADGFVALDSAGESNVFEDLAADGAMAAGGEVSIALDEQELSVGCGEA